MDAVRLACKDETGLRQVGKGPEQQGLAMQSYGKLLDISGKTVQPNYVKATLEP